MKINFLRTKLLPGKCVLPVLCGRKNLQHRHDERWWKHFQQLIIVSLLSACNRFHQFIKFIKNGKIKFMWKVSKGRKFSTDVSCCCCCWFDTSNPQCFVIQIENICHKTATLFLCFFSSFCWLKWEQGKSWKKRNKHLKWNKWFVIYN